MSRPTPNESLYKASILTDTDPQIDRWAQERIRVQVADNVLASKHATLQHPDRVEYRKQLKVLDDKIAARRKEIQDNSWDTYKANFELERSKKLMDTDADLTMLKDQIANLSKRVDEEEEQARQLGNKTQPILALREQIKDAKDASKRYNDRIAEIENQTRAPGRVTLLGPTVQPKTPTVDRWPKVAAAANGGGLFLGFIVLVILMKLRNKIDQADDLPEHFQPLVVGTVSHAALAASAKTREHADVAGRGAAEDSGRGDAVVACEFVAAGARRAADNDDHEPDAGEREDVDCVEPGVVAGEERAGGSGH